MTSASPQTHLDTAKVPISVTIWFSLVAGSMVLYIYRFPLLGFNVSLYRLMLIAWTAGTAIQFARGRIRLETPQFVLAGIIACIALVNAVDFAGLGEHPGLRRDIVAHASNLTLCLLVAVHVRSRSWVRVLLQTFVLSSLVTTAITIYSGIYDRVPFETELRTFGSEIGRSLRYINDDLQFVRATSSFFDPNFYGVYSMLVLIASMYLWLFVRPSWWLRVLFPINLVCLTLTLSRTAVIGLLTALALTFLLARQARVFCVAAATATVLLLYGSTAFQSHTTYAEITAGTKRWWTDLTTPAPSPPATDIPPAVGAHSDGREAADDRASGAAAPTPMPPAAGGATSATPPPALPVPPADPPAAVAPTTPLPVSRETATAVQTRVTDERSLTRRLDYIQRGWTAFKQNPIFGSGTASLLAEGVDRPSAHVTYLTLLARYGVVGAAVYAVFLLYPLWAAWRRGRSDAHRMLVSVTFGALMVVYLSYDIMLSLEVQYLFFGLGYSSAWASTSIASPTDS